MMLSRPERYFYSLPVKEPSLQPVGEMNTRIILSGNYSAIRHPSLHASENIGGRVDFEVYQYLFS